MTESMPEQSEPEYAEEYSTAERIRLIAIYGVAGLAVIAIGKLWAFPALSASLASSPCREIFGVNGAVFFIYCVLLGVPLSCAIVVGAIFTPRAIRILREGRVPPSGVKVLRRTRIRRGLYAKIFGYAALFYPVLFIAIAVWGGLQAAKFIETVKQKNFACPAAQSVQAKQ